MTAASTMLRDAVTKAMEASTAPTTKNYVKTSFSLAAILPYSQAATELIAVRNIVDMVCLVGKYLNNGDLYCLVVMRYLKPL